MGVTPDMIPGSAATTSMRTVRNAEAVAIDQIPLTAVETFRRAIKENCAAGARLTAMVVLPDGDGILAVL
ncbi:MAG: hypothetical protein WBV96_26465, partial [Polyangia bacterium]